MQIIPDSYGVDFLEFNNCHDPADGQFAVKGQGRCLGDAARFAARRDADRFVGPLAKRTGIGSDQLWGVLSARKDVRQFARKYSAPGYMKQDIQRALRADAALTMFEPPVPHTQSPGQANVGARVALIEPRPGDRRAYLLSVLRHEHGHIDRTPLGKGGSMLNGVRLDKTQTEEVRAWKNAIRNSGGRVSVATMRAALKTYLDDHDEVHRMMGKTDEYFEFKNKYPGPVSSIRAHDALAAMLDKAADRFMDTKIMPPLIRYRRRVQRAAKAA